jgi:hypothetical protein
VVEDLDRDVAPELAIVGLPDCGRRAAIELYHELVALVTSCAERGMIVSMLVGVMGRIEPEQRLLGRAIGSRRYRRASKRSHSATGWVATSARISRTEPPSRSDADSCSMPWSTTGSSCPRGCACWPGRARCRNSSAIWRWVRRAGGASSCRSAPRPKAGSDPIIDRPTLEVRDPRVDPLAQLRELDHLDGVTSSGSTISSSTSSSCSPRRRT